MPGCPLLCMRHLPTSRPRTILLSDSTDHRRLQWPTIGLYLVSGLAIEAVSAAVSTVAAANDSMTSGYCRTIQNNDYYQTDRYNIQLPPAKPLTIIFLQKNIKK